MTLAALLPFTAEAQTAPAKEKVAHVKGPKAKPLCFLKTASANVPLNSAAIQALDKDWIKTVSVLKDKDAVDQFGPKAKAGVVLIELMPEQEQAFLQTLKDPKYTAAEEKNYRLDGAPGVALSDPLYVIKTKDGEVTVKKEDISPINPEWIKSIDVLKGSEAEKRYKEQGKNGVILITLAPEREQDVLDKLMNSN
ncbi:hypothetical protein [Rufibacter hautae]|uniref:Uncharacterized protein n=1 Tax=Rufibacter hautae TaxID=2595005 RepID=A0A5B6TGT3_9BACT|nr:hypothetical protein [Rufibacter hautae]KAA3438525.1 hypothetical protein FOA19_14930 [Rufibacter hautae]